MLSLFLLAVCVVSAFSLYGGVTEIMESGWDILDCVFVPVLGYICLQSAAYLVLGIPGVSR